MERNIIHEENLWESVQQKRESKHRLMRGQEYTLYYGIKKHGHPTQWIKRRFRIRELYKYHVLVENPLGVRQCFTYWEFFRRLIKTA